MSVAFTSRLTPKSYFLLLVRSVAGSLPTLVLLGLALLVSAGYVFWTFLPSCGGPVVAAIFAAVTAVVVLAFIVLVVLVAAAAQVLLGKNRNLYEPVEITADDEALGTRSALGEGRTRWTAFVRVRRLGGYVLLYQTSRTFFAVGGEGVASETLKELEALARRQTSR